MKQVVLLGIAAEDCFELGRLSYVDNDYYHTVLWMQAALTRWDLERVKTMDRVQILDYLAFSTAMVRLACHPLFAPIWGKPLVKSGLDVGFVKIAIIKSRHFR